MNLISLQQQMVQAKDREIDSHAKKLGLSNDEINALKTELGLTGQILKYWQTLAGIRNGNIAKEKKQQEEDYKTSFMGQLNNAITNIPTTMFNSLVFSVTNAVARLPLKAITDFWNSAWSYASKYYDQMNEIRVITGKTEEEASKLGSNLRDMAQSLSVTSSDLASAATIFYRQGLSGSDVASRLQSTIEYAKAANVETATAAELITAVTNSMGQSAEHVADVFLYLGDNAASSGEEIGQAMQRSAATANAAGISFELLGSYIAAVSETTRQDAGTIGTALNSIMARLTQVKQKGFNEEDETKVNDIAKALNSIGLELTDGNGKWKDMSVIFDQVAQKWGDLDDKTQNYLATVIAGTRQQNVFRTIMQDLSAAYDGTDRVSRIMELYTGAMNSAGTAAQKYSVYQESVAAAHDRMTASMEKLYSKFSVSFLKAWYGAAADLAEAFNLVLSGTGDEHSANYSTASNAAESQVRRLKELKTEYENLAKVRESYQVGEQKWAEANSRMAQIIQTLANEFSPFATKLDEIGGHFDSTADAIHFMNEELRLSQGLMMSIKTLDIGNNIADNLKNLSSAKNNLSIAEMNSGYSDLIYKTAQQMGYGSDRESINNALRDKDVAGMVMMEIQRMLENATLGQVESEAAKMLADMIMTDNGDFDHVLLNAMESWIWGGLDDPLTAIVNSLLYSIDDAQDDIKKVKEKLIDNFVSLGMNEPGVVDMSDGVAASFKKYLRESISKEFADGDIWSLDNDQIELAGIAAAEKYAAAFMEKVAGFETANGKMQDLSSKFLASTSEEDKAAIKKELSAAVDEYYRLYDELTGSHTTNAQKEGLVASLIAGDKEALDEAASAVDKFWAEMEKGQEAYRISQEAAKGWASETKKISDALAAAKGGDSSALSSYIADYQNAEKYSDDTRKSIEKTLPWIADFFLYFKDGSYDISNVNAAAEFFNAHLDETKTKADGATGALKSLKDAANTAYKNSLKKEALGGEGIADIRQQMIDLFVGRQGVKDIFGGLNGNVDMYHRPVKSGAEMNAAGWSGFTDQDRATLYSSTFSGDGVVINVTPILPNGEVLSPDELEKYVNELFESGDVKANDSKGLLLSFAEVGDGQSIEDVIAQQERLA